MATAHVLGEHRATLEAFAVEVRRNKRNFYPARLLSGRPMTPHDGMFRSALREILTTERFARLRRSPLRLRVLLGMGPGPSRLLVTGLAVLSIIRARPLRWLNPQVVDANQLANPAELIELIMASSAFPPFIQLPRRDGRAIIDGGAVEPVPLSALEGVRHPLVVLTRPFPPRLLPASLTVVAPRTSLGLFSWEASSERMMRYAFDEGRREGERFLRAAAD